MFRRALELEKEIQKVQRSTKTLFKFFASSHNWLRMKSRPYYAWSMQPFSHSIHWAILVLMILASPFAFLNSNGKTASTEAAGTTFTEDFSKTTYIDSSATTANWSTTIKKTSLPVKMMPTISTGLNNLPADTGQVVATYVSNSGSNNNYKTIIFSKTNIYRYDPDSTSGRINNITDATAIFSSIDSLQSAVYFPLTDQIYVFANQSGQTMIFKFDPNDNSIEAETLNINIEGTKFSAVYNPDDQIVYLAGGNGLYSIDELSGSSIIYSFNPTGDPKVELIQNEPYDVEMPNIIIGGNVFYHKDGANKYLYYVGGHHGVWGNSRCVSYERYDYEPFDYILDENENPICELWERAIWDGGSSSSIVRYDLNERQVDSSFVSEEAELGILGGAVQISPNNYYLYAASSERKQVLSFNPTRSPQVQVEYGPPLNPDLDNASVVYDSNKDKIYLIGGYLNGTINTDIYIGSNDFSGNFSKIDDVAGPTYFTGFSAFSGVSYASYGNFAYMIKSTKINKYDFTTGIETDNISSIGSSMSRRGRPAKDGKIYFAGCLDHAKYICVFDPQHEEEGITQVGSGDILLHNGGTPFYNPDEDENGTMYFVSRVDSMPPYKTIVQKWPVGQTTAISEDNVYEALNDSPSVAFSYLNGRFYVFGHSDTLRKPYYYSFDLNGDHSITPTYKTDVNFGSDLGFHSTDRLEAVGTKLYWWPGNQTGKFYEITINNGTPSPRALPFTLPVSPSGSMYLATFIDDAGYFYNFTSSGALQKFNPFYQESAVVQSNKINTGSASIYKVGFTAECDTPDKSCAYSDGRAVSFEVSIDGGQSWNTIDNGGSCQFSKNSLIQRAFATNPDLRWRATLEGTDTLTPEITKVSVSYFGASAGLSIGSAGADKGAGEPTDAIGLSILDSAGVSTVANADMTITLSSPDSSRARFSLSSTGPWTPTLPINIAKNAEPPSFYYLNYDPGPHTVAATSAGLAQGSLVITTGPGQFGASFGYSKNPLVVSDPNNPNRSNISVALTGLLGASVDNKTVSLHSSKSGDVIEPDQSQTDSNGATSGTIYSKYAGNKTISIQIMPDNVWVEAQDKLTFIPAQAIEVRISSSKNGSVKAGEEFTVTSSLYDAFGNLATNSSNQLEVSSSDPTFQTQTLSATSGKRDFKITLKSAGEREVTVRDKNANTSASFKIFVLHDDPLASSSHFTTDKGKLVLNHDKANLTLKIADRFGNGISNVNVHIKGDFQNGTLSATNATTNGSGLATFVYTPTKEGKETLTAYTDTFEIGDKVVLENVADNLANQIESLIDDLQNSKVAKAIANVANAIVAATAALGLIPLIAGIISGAPAAAHAVTYAFSLGLEAIGAKKRRRSWGRVYDSTTGRGIDMATVRLFDQGTMKLVSTVVTDLKGHFSFQPEAGKYTVSVIKDSYVFPTNIFAKYGIATIDKSASRINSHYVGQTVTVTGDNNLVNLEIPIDPHNKKPTFMVKAKVFLSDFFEMATSGLSYIFMPSIVIGALLSVFAAVILPTVRNQTICLTYVLVALLYVISHLIKVGKFSTVYDQRDKKPIPEAVVSIFDKQYNTLKETRITDKFGRFSISVPKGEYRIKVEREGFIFPSEKVKKKKRFLNDGRYTNLYFGEEIDAKKEKFINVSVPMDEKYGKLTIK